MFVAKMVWPLEGDFSLEECKKMQIMSFDNVTFNIWADVKLAAMAIFYWSHVGAAKNEQSCQVSKN